MRSPHAFLLPLTLALLSACSSTAWPGGIHAVLRHRESTHALVVDEVPEGGAAARAGLRRGDRVLAIDGARVSELAREEVVARLRGQVGTRVRLTIERDGTEREVTVERGPVPFRR